MIYAVNEGHLDTVPVERVAEFQAGFLSFLETTYPATLETIRTQRVMAPEIAEALTLAIREYKQTAGYGR